MRHTFAIKAESVTEGKQYLDEMGVNISDIRQVSPGQVKVSGTPTLILVNESGVVVDVCFSTNWTQPANTILEPSDA